MTIRNLTSLFLIATLLCLFPACSERQRITRKQQQILSEIDAKRQASEKLLTNEDLVDSLRYLNDSGYRVAIMKQAQSWIIASDSLLEEAENLQQKYDSLNNELFMLDL